MFQKPKYKRKSSNHMPDIVIKQVIERDDGICQYCGRQGANVHHIAYGGTGRARRHVKENLITLCLDCHSTVHRDKEMRAWTYEWSRMKYGSTIDKLLELKWSNEKV